MNTYTEEELRRRAMPDEALLRLRAAVRECELRNS